MLLQFVMIITNILALVGKANNLQICTPGPSSKPTLWTLVDVNANAALYKRRCLRKLAFCRSCYMAMYSGGLRIGGKRIFPKAQHLLQCGLRREPLVRSSIQKREPQWLHCSFKCPNTCWSTCRLAKGYRKSRRVMWCLA